MTQELLRLHDAKVKMDGRVILDVDDFVINQGERIVVLGPNGSGKSTLAKHINALLAPTAGRVMVGSRDTHREEDVLGIREAAGMVFQNPDNQAVASIVRDDVAFGPENLGLAPDEIRVRVDEALAVVAMQGHAEEEIASLSGGQKQRIAIARAMLKNAPVVILDEATAYIDPENEALVQKAISTLTVGKTLIVIAHRLSTIVGADNIVVVKDGTIHAQGTHEKLLETCPLYRDMWQAHIGAKDQM